MTLIILIGVASCCGAAFALITGLALGRAAAGEDARRRECRLVAARRLTEGERSSAFDQITAEVAAIAGEAGEIAAEGVRLPNGAHSEAERLRSHVPAGETGSHLRSGEAHVRPRLPAEAA